MGLPCRSAVARISRKDSMSFSLTARNRAGSGLCVPSLVPVLAQDCPRGMTPLVITWTWHQQRRCDIGQAPISSRSPLFVPALSMGAVRLYHSTRERRATSKWARVRRDRMAELNCCQSSIMTEFVLDPPYAHVDRQSCTISLFACSRDLGSPIRSPSDSECISSMSYPN